MMRLNTNYPYLSFNQIEKVLKQYDQISLNQYKRLFDKIDQFSEEKFKEEMKNLSKIVKVITDLQQFHNKHFSKNEYLNLEQLHELCAILASRYSSDDTEVENMITALENQIFPKEVFQFFCMLQAVDLYNIESWYLIINFLSTEQDDRNKLDEFLRYHKLNAEEMLNTLDNSLVKFSFLIPYTAPNLNLDIINIIASLCSYKNTLSRLRQTSKTMDALIEQTPAGQLARVANNIVASIRPASPFLTFGFFSNENSRQEARQINKNNKNTMKSVVKMREPLSRPYRI